MIHLLATNGFQILVAPSPPQDSHRLANTAPIGENKEYIRYYPHECHRILKLASTNNWSALIFSPKRQHGDTRGCRWLDGRKRTEMTGTSVRLYKQLHTRVADLAQKQITRSLEINLAIGLNSAAFAIDQNAFT